MNVPANKNYSIVSLMPGEFEYSMIEKGFLDTKNQNYMGGVGFGGPLPAPPGPKPKKNLGGGGLFGNPPPVGAFSFGVG